MNREKKLKNLLDEIKHNQGSNSFSENLKKAIKRNHDPIAGKAKHVGSIKISEKSGIPHLTENHFGARVDNHLAYRGKIESDFPFGGVYYYRDNEISYGGHWTNRDFFIYNNGEISVAIQGEIKEDKNLFGKPEKDFAPLLKKLDNEIKKTKEKLREERRDDLISLLP